MKVSEEKRKQEMEQCLLIAMKWDQAVKKEFQERLMEGVARVGREKEAYDEKMNINKEKT